MVRCEIKQEKYGPYTGEMTIDTFLEVIQVLGLLGKDATSAVLSMLKKLKEIMPKESGAIINNMSPDGEYLKSRWKFFKKHQIETPDLESTKPK